MKGTTGLMIAAGLGLFGALCNWFYMSSQAGQFKTIEFVGVRQDQRIEIGEKFKPEHFEVVRLPKNREGNLRDHAVLWETVETVYSSRAHRTFRGGEILMLDDLETPSWRGISERLGQNQVAKWVPVDSRTFVSEKVNPGDAVAFTLPALGTQQNTGSGSISRTETFGPFTVLALGTRTSSRDVEQAAGSLRASSEHVLTIAVDTQASRSPDDPVKLEPQAKRLFDLLRASGYQPAEVTLFPANRAEERAPGRNPS